MDDRRPLSRREREVLALVAEGYTNRGIAARLDISAQTVKNHVTAIIEKTGARNRTHAVALSLKEN